jgi:hypothetical protein
MKKLILFIPIFLISISMIAQPPAGTADKGMIFGAKTTIDGAINADDLTSISINKSSSSIKVKGKVVEVCKAEGCWIKMQTSSGLMMIKMKDHAFLVPLDLNGKTIVAQGIAAFKETSVDMLRHFAQDAGKTKEEIAAIKNPKKEMSMQATGILVL